MIELFRSNDPVLVSFVGSLLADAKIEHSVADTHMSSLSGSIAVVERRVLVAESQLDAARQLLIDAEVPVG